VLVVVAVPLAFAPSALAAEGQPTIVDAQATNITEDSATLEAQIDPEGSETTYEFWREFSVCQHPSDCEAIAVGTVGEGHIAAGDSEQTVSVQLSDLQPGYSYSYWAVATNSAGKVQSRERVFETQPAGACSEGCHEEVPPYESKLSPGIEESARNYAEGALAREAERQAKAAKEQAEREAANKAGQPVAPITTSSSPTPAIGGLSLDGTSLTVQSNGMALVKLNCLGVESCRGKLTLTAKVATKAKGKKKLASAKTTTMTTTIGTVGFSIAGDETKAVKVDLNAPGRMLLKADHGRCDASLAILELAPGAENTQGETARLVQAKAAKAKRR